MRRCLFALLVARAWAQPGSMSMHPIDFDGDGDIDIVKSSPIGLVWLENHGNDAEWETHVIHVHQHIKDAVIESKKARKFEHLMKGTGPYAQEFEPSAEAEEEEEDGGAALPMDMDCMADFAPFVESSFLGALVFVSRTTPDKL